jgi:hypothetical protein
MLQLEEEEKRKKYFGSLWSNGPVSLAAFDRFLQPSLIYSFCRHMQLADYVVVSLLYNKIKLVILLYR